MTNYVKESVCWKARPGPPRWSGTPGSRAGGMQPLQEGTEASGHTAALQPAGGNAIIFPGRSHWLCNVPQNHAGLYKHSCFSWQKYFHSSPSIRQGTCFLWPAVAETNPQGERRLKQWSPAAPLRKAVNPRGGCSQLQRETDLLIHSATSEHQAGHDGDQHVPQLQPPTNAGSPEGPKHSQEPMDKSSRSRLKGNLRNQFPDPHLALALLPENARTLLSSQQLPSH